MLPNSRSACGRASAGGIPRAVKSSALVSRWVGVMGPEFGFPQEGTSLWMHNLPSETIRPGGFGMRLVGRLAPGADHAELSAQLAALAKRLPHADGREQGRGGHRNEEPL